MQEGDFLFFKDRIIRSGQALLSPNDRSFRYADGCFETMRVRDGEILLKHYHFERLFSALYQLKYHLPTHYTAAWLEEQVLALVEKNGHRANARIRLTLSGGEGGLYEAPHHGPLVLIQSWPLQPRAQQLNENGLELDICPGITKPCDSYSHIKSSNYLPYVIGAQWAKEAQLNDAIILNSHGRVADTTIANIFLIHNGVVMTPALTEGPVDGVMRRHILQLIQQENIPCRQTAITPDLLQEASEVWVSNAVMGIKWVKRIGAWQYPSPQIATLLYKKL